MPSSTFSSDRDNYERPLPSTPLKAAAWMALPLIGALGVGQYVKRRWAA